MNILLVAPDFPYPPNHGGRVDIWSRIKCLSQAGATIDLVVTAQRQHNKIHEPIVHEYVRNIFYFPRKKNLDFILQGTTYQIASRSGLEFFNPTSSYALAILESEAVSAILPALDISTKKALRVHNNEVTYFKSLAQSEKNIFLKTYYYIESILYNKILGGIKDKFDYILHISKDEFELDRQNIKIADKCRFLPPYLDLVSMKAPLKKNTKIVLFIGNLFTPNNIAGLEWYMNFVHKIVFGKISDYKLIIAGNTRGNIPKFIKSGCRNIEFFDSPKSLNIFYQDAAVFINPMLFGAGVKLRTINAIIEGVPIVATTVGAEGIGLIDKEHYALADTVESFANSVIELLSNPQKQIYLAKNAQKYITENFNTSKTIDELFKIN